MAGSSSYGNEPLPPGATKETPIERVRELSEGHNEVPEETLWEGGYSAADMYGWWMFSAIVAVVGIVVSLVVPMPLTWMIAGAVVGLIVLWGLLTLVGRKMSVGYKLTTQRFIHRHGILTRVTDRIEVIDINDVSFRQGLFERMFGVGTIALVSSDRSHPELVLRGIAQVGTVADIIDEVRRKERRRRGVHIAG